MADNIAVLDGAGASTTVRTTDTAGVHTPHHIVASSALPTGAATSANQSTTNTALAAIEAAVEAIQTAVELLDNAVSGSLLSVQQAELTRAVDEATVVLQSNALMNGTTALTPAFAIIDAAGSGDNTLLAAQGAGNKIRVHSLYLVAAGAVNVRFESGAGGTALSGQLNLAANGGFVLPFNPVGWFETAANALLNLELSGAVSVDGGFQYTVVV